MDAPWQIELFGGLRATRGSQVVRRFRMQKVGALLAYLAYYRHRSHPRDAFLDLLWPDEDLNVARNRFRVALASLRRQLEPPGVAPGAILRADHASVQLNPDAVATDVAAFESALAAADRTADRTERVEHLSRAADLYRGELLPGYYDDWILSERERLAEAHLQALGRLTELSEVRSDLNAATQWARRMVTADPLREERHRELIRLLALSGQSEGALRQYRELERLLDEQLGDAPSTETRVLIASLPSLDAPPHGRRATSVEQRASSAPSGAIAPPSGTVTFLLTDIEGSTRHWERGGEQFGSALEQHHELCRRQFAAHSGYEVKELGDGFLVAFERAGAAVRCALAAQRALAAVTVNAAPVRVRMALHTGDVVPREGDYHGLVVHHAQRALATGHGGQILCTEATALLIRGEPAEDLRLVDLGIYRLRDVTRPEHLFQVEAADAGRLDFPPLRAEPGFPSRLPLQFTPFFGREAEIAHLCDLLGRSATSSVSSVTNFPSRPRIVTLTGPGGSGKTRLAMEVARRLVDAWRGAVWFASLSEIGDAGRLAEAVRDGMGLPRAGEIEPLLQVVEVLGRGASLLVLDNFEHLIGEGTRWLEELRRRAPELSCLVTSQQPMGLPGEIVVELAPLPVPDEPLLMSHHSSLIALSQSPSVQLFVDRAQAVRPDFQVTAGNAEAVAAICRQLEGLPLALELAAARIGLLTPAQILTRLEQRLDLLARRRGGIARHQSVRAALDWSHQLLAPSLQQFFAQVAVFRGGFTLEAAEAVCESGFTLDDLSELRACSLIQVEEHASGMRYRLLETIRAYAEERLRETVDGGAGVRRRHLEHFLRLSETLQRQLRTSEEEAGLQTFGVDHENLRSAVTTAREEGADAAALQLALVLGQYLSRQGDNDQAMSWTRIGLDAARDGGLAETERYGRLLSVAAAIQLDRFAWEAARESAEEARRLHDRLGDDRGRAEATNLLGLAAHGERDYRLARELFGEARAVYARLDHHLGLAMTTNNLGRVEWADPSGDREKAKRQWEEALSRWRGTGDMRGLAGALINLGAMSQIEGDLALAEGRYREALRIQQALPDPLGIGTTLVNLAEVAEARGEFAGAHRLATVATILFGEIGSPLRQYAADLVQRVGPVMSDEKRVVSEAAGGPPTQPASPITHYSLAALVRWAMGEER